MMMALIDEPAVNKIKNSFRTGRVAQVPPSHRVEAMARGLGFRTHASLTAAIRLSRLPCSVDDGLFCKYLTEKGFPDVEHDTLSTAVALATFAVSFIGSLATTVHAPYPLRLARLDGRSPMQEKQILDKINHALREGREETWLGGNDVFTGTDHSIFAPRDFEGEEFVHQLLARQKPITLPEI